jgi:hypothetical protein
MARGKQPFLPPLRMGIVVLLAKPEKKKINVQFNPFLAITRETAWVY